MISTRFSRHSSLLGIAIDNERMTAAVARRIDGRIQVSQAFQTSLSLDLLADDPELVGREIRNQLSAAKIRKRRCVICVPLRWALIMQIKTPDLSETDMDSFLTLQAERGFPFAPEDLLLSVSRYHTPDGAGHATIAAIPTNRLEILQKALNAANLRPLSVTFGITSLLTGRGKSEEAVVSLLFSENAVEMGVTAGGGIVSLRTLDEAVETDIDGIAFDVDTIVRQIRITLGQLPRDLKDSIRTVRVFGSNHLIEPVIEELRVSVAGIGLSAEIGDTEMEGLVAGADAIRNMTPIAVGVVARSLLDEPSDFEFLPVRPSRFKTVTSRISTRGALWLAGVLAVLILGFGVVFTHQHWRLSRLEKEWQAIGPRSGEVNALVQRVRHFRPWFADYPQSLLVLRKLTEAFPEDGAVWAKSVGIRNLSEVSCSGNARTNGDWLKMLDRLRETKGVENLQVLQVQGDAPLRFTLSFRWNAGEADGI